MKSSRNVKIEGRSYPAGVTHIGTDVICGVRVPIIEGTAETISQLVTASADEVNDGSWCGVTTTIYLRRGQSPTQRRDSLNHERVHAFLMLSGLGPLLEGVVQWREGYDKFEEILCRIAAPHLNNALADV